MRTEPTRIRTDIFEQARARLEASRGKPRTPLTPEIKESLKKRTPLEELTTKWHDDRQKSDQGGDS